jgi:iron complex transport system ATP-binding protein
MDSPDGPPWLRAENLEFSHGTQKVLRNVNLDFFPGRHYAVLGPNGAGKSTLLDVLSRLSRPAAGVVRLLGKSIAGYPRRDLAKIVALAPQEYRFDFPFTIREVARMGRRPHLGRWGLLDDADRRRADEAVAAVNLQAIADKPMTALSGGERRRAVVARAIAQDTRVLLLDEPTSGLDVSQALSVMALAKRTAEAGRLVVTVSHDLDLASAFCHEAVFLKNGKVIANGPIAESFSDSVLSDVYDAEARLRPDDFRGGLTASFRLPVRSGRKEHEGGS